MAHLRRLALVAIAAGGLVLGGAVTASATTLEVGGVAQNKSVAVTATLANSTSWSLADSTGFLIDTGLISEFAFSTDTFTGSNIGGKVSKFTLAGATEPTVVLSPGSVSIAWTSGTNGTLTSSGAEWTIKSTLFGLSCIVKTGTGKAIGTITGTKTGYATLDINGSVDGGACGSLNWRGTYTITSPTALGVAS